MSVDREVPLLEKPKLLYPVLKSSMPHRADARIASLMEKDYLVAHDDITIIGKYEASSRRRGYYTDKDTDLFTGMYVVYDARNGQPNYAANYRRVEEKIAIEGGIAFLYSIHPNYDPSANSFIDTVQTRIKVLPDGIHQARVSFSTAEYDAPDAVQLYCNNLVLPIGQNQNLEWQMNRIGTQIAMIARADKGHDVFKYSKLL